MTPTLSVMQWTLNWGFHESLCAPGKITRVSWASNILPLKRAVNWVVSPPFPNLK